MKKVKHAVVLVNYNNWQDTEVCLNSIDNCKDKPHLIVVDNGSDNNSVEKLRRKFPNLDLITSSTNLGYAGGNNLGIKRAKSLKAKVVYLLNNDTQVDENLFYRAFRIVAGKNRLVGGKIYYARGFEFHAAQRGRGDVLWYAGGQIDWSTGLATHTGVDQIDQGQYDRPKDVEFITGCFLAIPRRALTKVGLLDETYFLYLEDAEYCLRALKAGYQLKYSPKLVLYHRNSASTVSGSPLVDYYLTRNRFLLARRYGSWRLILALVREALTRNWDHPVRRTAFLDFLTGKMGNRNEKIRQLTANLGQ